ncbi:NUDIX domain-containing protein [Catellatospora sp. KI3]|uniref:NUDIX domain-containing protein n=1 Tax=Catellatospora sp. KI3 TaxID=3041620 RepID=UPI00248267A4|nr:NUDIX domain-containing protein [Catellatospora sp. KI3]MDI1463659.1 NUDIX domain-containing protein [Catellatospora sp. KI3]
MVAKIASKLVGSRCYKPLMVPNVPRLARHFTPETLRTHLLSRAVRTPSGCLEFQGFGKDRRAYQKISVSASAHVAAYAAFVGEVDPTLVIDHLCDNPPCIEPSHLRQITAAENQARKRGKARSCVHPRQTDQETGRLRPCAECNAEAQRRWRTRGSRQEPDRSDRADGDAAPKRRAAAVIVRDGHVLMVRERGRGPSGRHDGLEYWTLPGGGIADGESAEEAVVREVAEEVGLTALAVRHLGDLPFPSGPTAVFSVDVAPGEPVLGVADADCDCPAMVGVDWVPLPRITPRTAGLPVPPMIIAWPMAPAKGL